MDPAAGLNLLTKYELGTGTLHCGLEGRSLLSCRRSAGGYQLLIRFFRVTTGPSISVLRRALLVLGLFMALGDPASAWQSLLQAALIGVEGHRRHDDHTDGDFLPVGVDTQND